MTYEPTPAIRPAHGWEWLRGSGLVGRAVALLLVLVGIKLLLLALLHDHLFESHWRVVTTNPTAFDHANFYGFVLLFMWSFVRLGREAGVWSCGTIRGLNLVLIAAGLLFVFLSFHQADSNNLYPVMQGVLSLRDVGWYLSLKLFFARPWLAAYLVAYPILYWLLARRQREASSFYWLGAIGAFYLLVNLRELAHYGDVLLVVNCVGLACLLAGQPAPGARQWPTRLGWLAGIAAVWVWFARQHELLGSPDAYLVLLIAISFTAMLSLHLAARSAGSAVAVGRWLPFYFVAFLLLSNHHYPPAAAYSNFLVHASTLPRYFTGEALSTGFLLVAGALALRAWPRFGRGLFDVTALLLIGVATVDLLVTRKLGVRLDWNLLALSDDPVKAWRTVRPFVPLLLVGGAVVVAGYFGLTRAGRWFAGRRVAAGAMRPGFALTLTGLLALTAPLIVEADKATGTGLGRLTASSPLLQGLKVERLTAEKFLETAAALRLPVHATDATPATNRPAAGLNVVLVVMESTYNRYLSLFGAADETQPLLKRYRERMELFPNFYSPFPNSFHARFSIFNGLYAPKEYVSQVNPRIPCPSLFEILHEHGYLNSVFYSSTRKYTQLDDYLGHRRLDVFHDCDSMPGREKFKQVSWGIEEGATLAAIQAQLRGHAARRERFSLTYIPAAPHMPYDSPSKEFERFDNGIGALDHDYSGRYKNQLLYMDWVITSIIDSLAENGQLDQTLVLITNDHGEMVGEDDGVVGHGWKLDPTLCNTPLIVLDPRRPGARMNPVPGSHVDVLPTILDRLGLPLPPGELYQGISLDSAAARDERVIYLNSYGHHALIRDGQYFLLDPDQPGAATEVFDIRLDGARTEFRKSEARTDIASQHEAFVRFQKSLIVHYAHYRAALAEATRASANRPAGTDRATGAGQEGSR